MNSDTLTQLLQKGFRVTLGATASLVEALQDPEHRQEKLSRLTSDFGQLTEEWEAKGATTEQEARNFVDNLWRQSSVTPPPSSSAVPVDSPDPGVQEDLQELTAQIAAMRAEIEKLRAQDNP